MASYKVSRSLNGDTMVWIARVGKRVVVRADSEEDLQKLIEEREAALKKSNLKDPAEEDENEGQLIEVSPPAPPKKSDEKFEDKKKLLENKLKTKIQKKKQETKTSGKKSFWDNLK